MSTEENKALSNKGAEAISRGDFAALDEIYAPEVARELKQAVAELRQAFPDYHGTNDIQIAEGDMVANRWLAHGTHRGEFMGIAPTGREVTFRGIAIDRMADGKIVGTWARVGLGGRSAADRRCPPSGTARRSLSRI